MADTRQIVNISEYRASRDAQELTHLIEPTGETSVRVVIEVDDRLELRWELSRQDARRLARALFTASHQRDSAKLVQTVHKPRRR